MSEHDPTIRDKSIQALAEALGDLWYGDEAASVALLTDEGGVVVTSPGAIAEGVLSDPTLARRLDFATAWDEAVAAAEAAITEDIRIEGEAVGIVGVVPYSFGDHAYVAQTYPPVHFASAYSETPTEALVALAEALRERAR